MFKKTALTSLLALSCIPAAQAQLSFLQDSRQELTFPDYTYEQKALVAEQAKLILDGLYVHKYAKNLYYGVSPTGHLDPVKEINTLINKMGSLSTEQFHKKIQAIFLSQRDLHLNYNYPAQLARYSSFIPMELAQTTDSNGNKEVRVSDVWSNFAVLTPDIANVTLGDKVLSYDGVDINTVVRNNYNAGAGANPDGGFVRALKTLHEKSHVSIDVPEKDEVTMVLESHETGEQYQITLPWLVFNFAPTAAQNQASAVSAQIPEHASALLKDLNFDSVDNALTQSNNLSLERLQQLESLADIDDNFALAANSTPEPTVTWNKVEVDGKKVGYLRIASFSPRAGRNTAIGSIIDALDLHLADTDALVVDVRDNPGGDIIYADFLLQLFTAKPVTPSHARFTNTELNQNLLNTGLMTSQWQEVLSDAAGTNSQYTKITNYLPNSYANVLGQAYYKPVGVWSNAKTYSAGDLFTCGMQDNGIAKVYGQHKRTGAGGANVMNHNVFVQNVGAPFEALPYGQGMRVSWRQSVRTGHHINSLIEDYGCVADHVVSYNLEDILNGDQEDFTTIARSLLKQRTNPSSVSFKQAKFAPTDGTFTLTVKNTELIDVYINDQKVERLAVYAYGTKGKEINYTLPEGLTTGNIKFVGMDGGKTPLWNSKRYFF
ncbi:S41 family peptidase (plasmid) [Pseudoalteromonas sp. T1lg65]|uniref:S41 family peptidase n=1 Tax=Pseudoalteromonas sp. T1lg65 TaxID=2077101 RepID=UPI003F7AF292